jgi:hypothetical protein
VDDLCVKQSRHANSSVEEEERLVEVSGADSNGSIRSNDRCSPLISHSRTDDEGDVVTKEGDDDDRNMVEWERAKTTHFELVTNRDRLSQSYRKG